MAIETYFKDIADAIRAKAGTSGLITPAQMPAAIAAIQSGLETISRADWNALTAAQKQSKGVIGIIDSNSGFDRGVVVNGADYIPVAFLANYGNGMSGTYTYDYTIPSNGVYLFYSIVGYGGEPAAPVHTIQPTIKVSKLLDAGNGRYVRYEISECNADDIVTVSAPTTGRANGGVIICQLPTGTYTEVSSTITRDGTNSYQLPTNSTTYIVIAGCTGLNSSDAQDNSQSSGQIYVYADNMDYEYTRFRLEYTKGNANSYSMYGYDGGCSSVAVYSIS